MKEIKDLPLVLKEIIFDYSREYSFLKEFKSKIPFIQRSRRYEYNSFPECKELSVYSSTRKIETFLVEGFYRFENRSIYIYDNRYEIEQYKECPVCKEWHCFYSETHCQEPEE